MRWNSPYINHFISPDTIIPDQTNPQSWDRYAYTFNNPLRYSDPSGHLPCFSCGFTSAVLAFFGLGPDDRGIANAESYVTDKNAIVGGGIAVQSQWYVQIWDNPGNLAASSYGLAQATIEELNEQDPMDPTVAESVMANRIKDSVALCAQKQLCQDDTDNFLIASMAQNGISPNGWLHVPSLPQSGDGSVDWDEVMTQGGNTGNLISLGRQNATNMNYNTQFMLNLFAKDVRALIDRGFTMPEQYDEVDWERIDKLLQVKHGLGGQ